MRLMIKRIMNVTVPLVLLFSLILFPGNTTFASTETVTVDFGNDIAPVSYIGSGFLNQDYVNLADDSLVTQLKPQRVRTSNWDGWAFDQYDKIASLGIPEQIIAVSDGPYSNSGKVTTQACSAA